MNSENHRRAMLRSHAALVLLYTDKAKATREILMWATRLVQKEDSPADTLMGDLKAVMVGEGYTDVTGRGRGPHYVETHPLLAKRPHRGSEGFDDEYKDSGFQVHHVIAAILIGRWPLRVGYPFGWYSEKAEWEKLWDSSKVEHHDIAVYRDFCEIGRLTNDINYSLLPDRVYEKLKVQEPALTTNPPNFRTVPGGPLAPVEYLTGVRERLKRLGYYTGPIDGAFDSLTRNAVISFQRANPPLKMDGIPGPKTQARIKAVHGS